MVLSIPRISALPVALLLPSVGLLLAYLYALSQRPGIPDYLTVSDPAAYGFPEWYGQSASPYDATWVERGKRKEESEGTDILLLLDLPYDSPNVPTALSTEKVLKSRPDLSVQVITNFSSSPEGVSERIKDLEPTQCAKWTWRISEKPSSTKGCEGSVWISEILGTGQGERSIEQTHDPRADIELLRRPQGLFEQQSTHAALKAQFGEDWQLGLMSHTLPFADPSIYYPTTYKSLRTITYFPSPFTKSDQYPSLPWSNGWKIYRPTTSKPRLSEGKDPMAADSKFRSFWAQEERRKSDVMRSSGICLFEDWAEGQVTVEMAQAMLSGCIVAMITPQTHYELLQPLVLTLAKPDMTLGQNKLPAQALAGIMARTSDDELKSKAMKAFIVARQMMTPTNRVKNVEGLVELWQDGGRGYNLPHAFSWNCDTEPRPPWC